VISGAHRWENVVDRSKKLQGKSGAGLAIIFSSLLSLLIVIVFSLKILIATVFVHGFWLLFEKRRFEAQKHQNTDLAPL